MSAVSNCCNQCGTTTTVNVPGSEGEGGTNGTDGVNAYTHTTADFTLPGDGLDVTVDVDSSVFMVIGQIFIIGVGYDGVGDGPQHVEVAAIPSSTSVTFTQRDVAGDLGTGDISSGSTVSPSAL